MTDQTVEDNGRRKQFTAFEGQTQFHYDFIIFEEADLDVYVTPVGSVPNPTSDIVSSSEYTITGIGDNDGGLVTFNTPLTLGDVVILNSDVVRTQTVDFIVGGRFNPSTVNFVNNKLTVLIQQLYELIQKQGVTYQVTDQLDPLKDNILPQLPANTGNGIPIWTKNGDGTLIAGLLVENEDASTLRSELANETELGNGANLIGYWRQDTMESTTVKETLDYLVSVVAGNVYYTSEIKFGYFITAPSGWILLDDGTIGNAASGASTRANADTEALFTQLWETTTDVECKVEPGGHGVSAAADFAADKTIQLPKSKGRAVAIYGQATFTHVFTADETTNIITIPASLDSALFLFQLFPGTPIQVTNAGGALPAPLMSDTTYYIGDISSNTFKLYSTSFDAITLATPIDITTNGTGTQTMGLVFSNRALATVLGEATHAVTAAETIPHTHDYETGQNFNAAPTPSGGASPGGAATRQTGNGTSESGLLGEPHNNMPPTMYLSAIIKL